MFILYAIPIGIVAGYLIGGRLDRLSQLRLRWAPLMLLGLALQIGIFSEAIGRAVGDAGPAIYIASAVIVFVVLARRRHGDMPFEIEMVLPTDPHFALQPARGFGDRLGGFLSGRAGAGQTRRSPRIHDESGVGSIDTA